VALSTRELYLVIRARDEASRVLRGLAGNMSHLTRAEQMAAQQSMMRGQALIGMGAAIGLTGAAGLKFFKDSTMAAVEYNRQAALTKTQVDNVHVSVKRLEDVGRTVARNIAVPFDTIQSSLYDIFSSLDVNVPQAQHLLTAFSKTAVAGQVDLQEASRATIAILNAYKMKTSEVGHVEDVMFQLVRKGVGTYAEFATTIGQAIPSARNAGQSIEGLAGMLAFLTRNGLSASRAATSAARALDTLTNAGTMQRFHKLGIEVHDAAGNFRPISAIATELGKKLDGLTQAQRSKKLAALFTGSGYSIQARRFWNLAIRNYSQLNSLTGSMAASTGQLNRAYKTMSNTPAAKAQLLSNRFKILRTEIGDALIPVFTKLVSWLSKVVQYFDDLSPAAKRNIAIIGATVSAMLLLMGVVTALAGLFLMFQGAAILAGMELGNFVALLGGAGVAMAALTIAAVLVVGALVNAHDQTKAFNQGLHALATTNDWTTANKVMDSTDKKLASLGSSFFAFTHRVNDWRDVVTTIRTNVAELSSQFGVTQSAVFLLSKAAGVITGSFESARKGMLRYRSDVIVAAGGNKVLAGTMAVLTAYTETAKNKITAFHDALDALIGINQSVHDSMVAAKQSINDLSKNLDKNSASISGNSKAGAKNSQAISNTVALVRQHAEAVYQSTLKNSDATTEYGRVRDATEQATKALNNGLQAIIKNKDLTDANRQAAKKYIAMLLGVPPRKVTQVLLQGQPQAVQGVKDFIAHLAQIPRTTLTTLLVNATLKTPKGNVATGAAPTVGSLLGSGLPGHKSHVQKSTLDKLLGIPGRARGGEVLRGMSYLVGEKGPELFTPHSSGQIITHGGSGQYEAAAGTKHHKDPLGRLLKQVTSQLNALRTQIGKLGSSKKVQGQLAGLRKERDALAAEQSALASAQKALSGSTVKDTKSIELLQLALKKLNSVGLSKGAAANHLRDLIGKLKKQRKHLEQEGTHLSKSVTKYFDESLSPLATHLSNLAKKVEDAATNAAGRMPKAIRHLVAVMKAQSQAVADEWSSMHDAISGTTDVVGAFSGGYAVNPTAIPAFLRHQIDALKKWAKDINKLAKRGLNKGLLRSLINEGPDDEPLVKALLTGNTVSEVNKLLKEAMSTEEGIETQFEKELFDKPKPKSQKGKSSSHAGASGGKDNKKPSHHHKKAPPKKSPHHAATKSITLNQYIYTEKADPKKLAADAGYEISRHL
jgi:TP901 family phage tail tape measure protein